MVQNARFRAYRGNERIIDIFEKDIKEALIKANIEAMRKGILTPTDLVNLGMKSGRRVTLRDL